ncbi:unnamed protein product [Effrenium voratum]|nr:unnamed protein product [Effrenium voratum]
MTLGLPPPSRSVTRPEPLQCLGGSGGTQTALAFTSLAMALKLPGALLAGTDHGLRLRAQAVGSRQVFRRPSLQGVGPIGGRSGLALGGCGMLASLRSRALRRRRGISSMRAETELPRPVPSS